MSDFKFAFVATLAACALFLFGPKIIVFIIGKTRQEKIIKNEMTCVVCEKEIIGYGINVKKGEFVHGQCEFRWKMMNGR